MALDTSNLSDPAVRDHVEQWMEYIKGTAPSPVYKYLVNLQNPELIYRIDVTSFRAYTTDDFIPSRGLNINMKFEYDLMLSDTETVPDSPESMPTLKFTNSLSMWNNKHEYVSTLKDSETGKRYLLADNERDAIVIRDVLMALASCTEED